MRSGLLVSSRRDRNANLLYLMNISECDRAGALSSFRCRVPWRTFGGPGRPGRPATKRSRSSASEEVPAEDEVVGQSISCSGSWKPKVVTLVGANRLSMDTLSSSWTKSCMRVAARRFSYLFKPAMTPALPSVASSPIPAWRRSCDRRLQPLGASAAWPPCAAGSSAAGLGAAGEMSGMVAGASAGPAGRQQSAPSLKAPRKAAGYAFRQPCSALVVGGSRGFRNVTVVTIGHGHPSLACAPFDREMCVSGAICRHFHASGRDSHPGASAGLLRPGPLKRLAGQPSRD